MASLAVLILLFFAGLMSGGLVVSWWIRRRQLHAEIERVTAQLDDAAVQRILQDGHLYLEETPPLDLEEIAEEEEKFWAEESWDPAEDY